MPNYVCTTCEDSFSNNSTYISHSKKCSSKATIHLPHTNQTIELQRNVMGDFICNCSAFGCPKPFKYASSLKFHIKKAGSIWKGPEIQSNSTYKHVGSVTEKQLTKGTEDESAKAAEVVASATEKALASHTMGVKQPMNTFQDDLVNQLNQAAGIQKATHPALTMKKTQKVNIATQGNGADSVMASAQESGRGDGVQCHVAQAPGKKNKNKRKCTLEGVMGAETTEGTTDTPVLYEGQTNNKCCKLTQSPATAATRVGAMEYWSQSVPEHGDQVELKWMLIRARKVEIPPQGQATKMLAKARVESSPRKASKPKRREVKEPKGPKQFLHTVIPKGDNVVADIKTTKTAEADAHILSLGYTLMTNQAIWSARVVAVPPAALDLSSLQPVHLGTYESHVCWSEDVEKFTACFLNGNHHREDAGCQPNICAISKDKLGAHPEKQWLLDHLTSNTPIVAFPDDDNNRLYQVLNIIATLESAKDKENYINEIYWLTQEQGSLLVSQTVGAQPQLQILLCGYVMDVFTFLAAPIKVKRLSTMKARPEEAPEGEGQGEMTEGAKSHALAKGLRVYARKLLEQARASSYHAWEAVDENAEKWLEAWAQLSRKVSSVSFSDTVSTPPVELTEVIKEISTLFIGQHAALGMLNTNMKAPCFVEEYTIYTPANLPPQVLVEAFWITWKTLCKHIPEPNHTVNFSKLQPWQEKVARGSTTAQCVGQGDKWWWWDCIQEFPGEEDSVAELVSGDLMDLDKNEIQDTKVPLAFTPKLGLLPNGKVAPDVCKMGRKFILNVLNDFGEDEELFKSYGVKLPEGTQGEEEERERVQHLDKFKSDYQTIQTEKAENAKEERRGAREARAVEKAKIFASSSGRMAPKCKQDWSVKSRSSKSKKTTGVWKSGTSAWRKKTSWKKLETTAAKEKLQGLPFTKAVTAQSATADEPAAISGVEDDSVNKTTQSGSKDKGQGRHRPQRAHTMAEHKAVMSKAASYVDIEASRDSDEPGSEDDEEGEDGPMNPPLLMMALKMNSMKEAGEALQDPWTPSFLFWKGPLLAVPWGGGGGACQHPLIFMFVFIAPLRMWDIHHVHVVPTPEEEEDVEKQMAEEEDMEEQMAEEESDLYKEIEDNAASDPDVLEFQQDASDTGNLSAVVSCDAEEMGEEDNTQATSPEGFSHGIDDSRCRSHTEWDYPVMLPQMLQSDFQMVPSSAFMTVCMGQAWSVSSLFWIFQAFRGFLAQP
ncbi:hypothetical protein BKA82DRAFT_961478 [Pisolithus tinctorius]|nr:hypothetical protein BKA82DRAFT_961478 [Pisolithus tinctorius]